MLRKFVLVIWLLLGSVNAGATEYTDAYVTPGELGWGALLVQSDTVQFIALFIYGQGNSPTWYTGVLTADGAGNYNGPLHADTGSPFSAPWDPAQQHEVTVGTISFAPTDVYHATLTYTLTGAAPVVKHVERFTLVPGPFNGNYSGSMTGSVTGCMDPATNIAAFRGRYDLAVTEVNVDQSATLTFNFVDNTYTGVVCTISGPLTHLGRLYQMNGQASCTGPELNTGPQPAVIDSLHKTGQGIEGHWTGSGGGGCNLTMRFAAVLKVNN
jgi:hypothetical protein